MTLVAGVDFGTASVRVSIFEVGRGARGLGVAPIATRRSRVDPLLATQKHADHLSALEQAFAAALSSSGVDGRSIASLAIDTTGSTVVALDARLQPISPYYLWCDHRAWREAEEITSLGAERLPALAWCGGRYSTEWGWSKVLHALRHKKLAGARAAAFAEHCDVMVATLLGLRDVTAMPRSACAAGHKWLWHDGWPPRTALDTLDSRLPALIGQMTGPVLTSDQIAGGLSPEWAGRLGLRSDIPVPVGALDAHWDAVGVGCRIGDAVNVLGTSGCLMSVANAARPIPGIPGVVRGSIHPALWGIEAGLAAVGALFEAIARRARRSVEVLMRSTHGFRPGQTGLIRLPWDHGDRGPHADATLRGVCVGWQLSHSAADELFAAIEGVALQTRLLLDRMSGAGVGVHRMIHAGGIPRRNPVLNQIFANVLQRTVLVPREDVTGRGSSMFAALAAGCFRTIEEAQAAMAPACEEIEPQLDARDPYDALYGRFATLYDAIAPFARAPVAESIA